jgi:predicted anti-sigma-YlaC factor YlaD
MDAWGDRRLIDKNCPVRPCVIAKGLGNCSECREYPCDKLADRLVVYEQLAAKHSCPIPPEDRARFITPYENKQRLDRLRHAREAAAGPDE